MLPVFHGLYTKSSSVHFKVIIRHWEGGGGGGGKMNYVHDMPRIVEMGKEKYSRPHLKSFESM